MILAKIIAVFQGFPSSAGNGWIPSEKALKLGAPLHEGGKVCEALSAATGSHKKQRTVILNPPPKSTDHTTTFRNNEK